MSSDFWRNLVARLTSRKFILAIVGVAAPILLDLTPEQMTAIASVIGVFIGVEGARDFKQVSVDAELVREGEVTLAEGDGMHP